MTDNEVGAQAAEDQRVARSAELQRQVKELDALLAERGQINMDDVVGKTVTVDAYDYFNLVALTSVLFATLAEASGEPPQVDAVLCIGQATLAGAKSIYAE